MPATVPSTKAFQSLGGIFHGLAVIDDPHGAKIMRDAVTLSEILELRQDVGEVRHFLGREHIDQPAIDRVIGDFARIVDDVERRLVRTGGDLVEPLHRRAEDDIDSLAGALLEWLHDAFAQALLPDATEGADRQIRRRCARGAGKCHRPHQNSACLCSELISHHTPLLLVSTFAKDLLEAFTIVNGDATPFSKVYGPQPLKSAFAYKMAWKVQLTRRPLWPFSSFY